MATSKVPALQRMNEILGFLAGHGSCVAADVAKSLPIPKSSVYLLLDELKSMNYLTQDGEGRYRLWMRLIELGESASEGIDIREVARRHLSALTEQTGLLCHLGIFDGNSAYYVLKIESSSTISVRSREGKVISLYRSGVGKCLLAWLPPEKQDELIAGFDYKRLTPTTITDSEAMRREIETIRTQGWALDDEEDVPSVRCVAAPVFDARGAIVAAISAVGATVQIAADRIPPLSAQVVSSARDISKELGWRGDAATAR